VRALKIDTFESELSKFPFLSEKEKVYPPTAQTWEKFRAPRLKNYPKCQNVRIGGLLDDRGMESYVLKVTVDGRGPFVLKVVRIPSYILDG